MEALTVASAHGLIRRFVGLAARVTDRGRDDPRELIVLSLRSPESSESEHRSLSFPAGALAVLLTVWAVCERPDCVRYGVYQCTSSRYGGEYQARAHPSWQVDDHFLEPTRRPRWETPVTEYRRRSEREQPRLVGFLKYTWTKPQKWTEPSGMDEIAFA